ncbi:MAG: hypothetical protein Q9169_003414 [Polycauliona sp. 2 TL-2023]
MPAMLHHKSTDKAKHFLDLLDTARCNGKWSDVPELVRKVGKHAPQRKCLQLTAQTESRIATTATSRLPNASSPSSKLSQYAPDLRSTSQAAADYPEDAFQARVCLAWLHWTVNEPLLALQSLPVKLTQAYHDLGRAGKITSGWTTICAIKGAFIQGELQDNAGKTQEALRTYASIMPVISSTASASRSMPEYRIWTERLLARYGTLMEPLANADGRGGQPRLYSRESLAPFRTWAELPWTNPAKNGNVVAAETTKQQASTGRRMWQLYYASLSFILQQGLRYPPVGHGPSTFTQGMTTENVNSLANLKLQQSIELRRVESVYEDVLLKEVSFPKANETNVEVESWTDQVIANWRAMLHSSWQNEDLGKGGKEAMTRNVLAVLYRAATRTFHSTRILRHLFTVHTALAEFNLASKAFDTYIELAAKGRARVDKSGEEENDLDDDITALEATAAGLEMLCFHGRRKQVERAQEIAAVLEHWLEQIESLSKPKVSANDNPKDLEIVQRKPPRPVPGKALAVAHRALGICRAYWARITHDVSSRPGLQAKAIASFRTSLDRAVAPFLRGEIHYALAVLLAETRDIDGAIQSVKSTIALCTAEMDEEVSEDQGVFSDPLEDRRRTLLFRAWHLLASLLSARHDFATAVASCDAAYELYGDLIDQTGRSRLQERLSLAEREQVLELKMSQVALTEILDGPEEAVNAGGDLLGLYKQLFDYEETVKSNSTPTAALLHNDALAPPRSANGTIRSARRSIFGRSKDAVGNIPNGGHQASNRSKTSGPQRGDATNPTIAVSLDGQLDGQTSERPYQPPHHLARQESKKLHKRQSRKSMASDHRGRGASTNRSSHTNGLDGTVHGVPSRITEMTRPSIESSYGSSLDSGRLSSDGVGVAITKNVPSDRNHEASGPAETSRSFPVNTQSTHHTTQSPSSAFTQSQPSDLSIPSAELPHPTDSLPDPIYPPTDLKRRALTLLTRIWLLIAQLYRDAAMPVDSQGALSEAFTHARSIESIVAATESSAQALSEPGWGNLKSIAEVWADVHAEQAASHLQLGATESASQEFEKALGWFPDHNQATVGLCGMLLDYYCQKGEGSRSDAGPEAVTTPASKPLLATLPTTRGASHTDTTTQQQHRPNISPGSTESPTLLSRLAARDRAYGLLSMLTKSGRGWDDSEAWFSLARVYEESGQEEKAMEALWWVVELEDTRPVRGWGFAGGF